MARGRRGGGSPSASRSRAPAPSRAPAKRPMSSTPAPAPAKSGGMLSGIGSTIAQGMAFGTGSAIAHQAVGAMAGSFGGGGGSEAAPEAQASAPAMDQQQQQVQGACGNDKTMFFECLQINKGDQQACSFLYENLQQCQRESSSMSFS